MRRPVRQFRPGTLELFESRVVPAVVAYPGVIPFIPPGQGPYVPNSPNFDFHNSNDPYKDTGYFDVADNTISTTVTNITATARYATFTVYTAPGGGPGGLMDNFSSQKLVYSETKLVGPGEEVAFSVDLSKLKLNGQLKCQGDVWDAGSDPNGFAPDKLKLDELSGRLIVGELFDYDPASGKKDHK